MAEKNVNPNFILTLNLHMFAKSTLLSKTINYFGLLMDKLPVHVPIKKLI